MTPRGAEQLFFCRNFHPFSEVGNSRLHSTFFNYSRFYGIVHSTKEVGFGMRHTVGREEISKGLTAILG